MIELKSQAKLLLILKAISRRRDRTKILINQLKGKF